MQRLLLILFVLLTTYSSAAIHYVHDCHYSYEIIDGLALMLQAPVSEPASIHLTGEPVAGDDMIMGFVSTVTIFFPQAKSVKGVQIATATGGRLLLKSGVSTLTQHSLEHIVARHWFSSNAKGVGKFIESTTANVLKDMINTVTTQGVFRPNTMGRAGTIAEYNFGKVIGTASGGAPATRLRVIIDINGNVITAFPF
jgi:hypothetical protein